MSDPDYAPVTRTMLSRRFTYLHTILQHFCTQWRREYLLDLRESHRHSQGHGSTKVSIGDGYIYQCSFTGPIFTGRFKAVLQYDIS